MLGKRIVSLILCFVTIFSLVGVVSAEDYVGTPVTFYDYLYALSARAAGDIDFLGPYLKVIGSVQNPIVCELSDDGLHHTDSIKGAHFGSDEHGKFAETRCKYCNRDFKVRVADFEAAYDDYTQDVKDKTGTTTLINGGIRITFIPSSVRGQRANVISSVLGPTSTVTIVGITSYNYTSLASFTFDSTASFVAPFTGYCKIGGKLTSDKFLTSTVFSGDSQSIVQGSPFYLSGSSSSTKEVFVETYPLYEKFATATATVYADIFPYTGIPGDYYDIDISNSTRPTVIIGDVGYYDSSNNLQIVNNTSIVNETNNTFFNPVTNLTTNIVNWSYDYSDRSYSLTLDTGDKVQVTYGSENITIIEGGNTYNVYYTVPKDTPTDPTDPTDPETAGFFAWWKAAWADFRTWLAGVLPGGDSPSVPDGTLPDLPGENEEGEGFSILDIIVKIVSALWRLISGFFGTIFGGVLQFFTSLGEGIDGFFSAFEGDSGVFGFGKYGGADIWD